MNKRILMIFLTLTLVISSTTVFSAGSSTKYEGENIVVTADEIDVPASAVTNEEGYASLVLYGVGPEAGLTKTALMDKNGKLIFEYGEFPYNFLIHNGRFLNGYPIGGGKYADAMFDLSGNVINTLNYDLLKMHHNGYLVAGKGTDNRNYIYSLVDHNGRKILDIPKNDVGDYVEVGGYSDGLFWFSAEYPLEVNIIDLSTIFKEGKDTDKIDQDETFGYMDFEGNIKIKQKYFYAAPFSEGLAAVQIATNLNPYGMTGFINKDGETVIDHKYNGASSFKNGYASVADTNDRWGFIDKKGNEVIPFIYDFTNGYGDGLFTVAKRIGSDLKYGCVDIDGKIVVPLDFDCLTSFDDNIAYGIKNKKVHILRVGKKEIVVPEEPVTGDVAVPTKSKVLINGKTVSFDAYNIEGHNYFKLRDLAYSLSGTEKQFDVTWDNIKKAINIKSGKRYTIAGGEMASKGTETKYPQLTTSKIFLNDKIANFTAYNIDDNNYFKLRDVGKHLNFGIAWDAQKNTISIDTKKGYVE